ncbi:MAG: SDR family oxidoreductase [Tahibacter sp.]
MSYVVVSGANRGLGLELVRQLLEQGRRVIAACRKPAQANPLTALSGAYPGHLKALPLNVASERSIDEFVREVAMLGITIDLLINNAGVLVSGERLGALAAKPLAESYAANAIGPLLLSQALLPQMEKGKKSLIVNISSSLGSLQRTQAFGTVSYAMSKAALNMVTRQLAAELASERIAVVSVHPGWVQTDMGGAGASLAVAPAVTALLARVNLLGMQDTGRFIGTDGADLPW